MQENCDMDDLSIVTLIDGAVDRARTMNDAPEDTRWLGPNQLSWLRLNIDSFRYSENQQALLRHDTVRAARVAGLIGSPSPAFFQATVEVAS